MLGFYVRGNANFMFRVGGKTNFSVFRYQHVGIANEKCFCVAVEYMLKMMQDGVDGVAAILSI